MRTFLLVPGFLLLALIAPGVSTPDPSPLSDVDRVPALPAGGLIVDAETRVFDTRIARYRVIVMEQYAGMTQGSVGAREAARYRASDGSFVSVYSEVPITRSETEAIRRQYREILLSRSRGALERRYLPGMFAPSAAT